MSKLWRGVIALSVGLTLGVPVVARARGASREYREGAQKHITKSKDDDAVSPAFQKMMRVRSRSDAGNPGGKAVHGDCGVGGCVKRHAGRLTDEDRD